MTREEAISDWTFRSNHIKKWLDEHGEEPSIRHYVELIDMAIEALKAKTDGDLIRRQDAIDAVDRVDEAHMRLKGRPMLGWCTLLDEIESIPSAGPKTGEWIQDDDYICDQCGYHMIVGDGAYNFCPNCGAKMLGEDGEA